MPSGVLANVLELTDLRGILGANRCLQRWKCEDVNLADQTLEFEQEGANDQRHELNIVTTDGAAHQVDPSLRAFAYKCGLPVFPARGPPGE